MSSESKIKPKKDPKRYQRQHRWTYADAMAVIEKLQGVVWPHGWHVALGGGVLNHGYSDNDLDLYLLPIYGEEPLDELLVLTVVLDALGAENQEQVSSTIDNPHECYKYQERIFTNHGPIEMFIVRRQSTVLLHQHPPVGMITAIEPIDDDIPF